VLSLLITGLIPEERGLMSAHLMSLLKDLTTTSTGFDISKLQNANGIGEVYTRISFPSTITLNSGEGMKLAHDTGTVFADCANPVIVTKMITLMDNNEYLIKFRKRN
jgi:hypothetical protein